MVLSSFCGDARRRRQIARAEQRSGKALTDEEKAKIEPISEGSEFYFLRFSLCYPWYSLCVHLFLNHSKFHQDQWKQHCV